MLLQSLDMFYASQQPFYVIKNKLLCFLCFLKLLFIFFSDISKVLGTKWALYHENGFWCSCQFYWTHIITNIENVPYIG